MMYKTEKQVTREILEDNGYVFSEYVRPYDIFKKGRNTIGVCMTCRIVSINGNKLRVGRSFPETLTEYFKNQKNDSILDRFIKIFSK